ncbi:hypothetical protein [Ectothiorhodospira mobilis]|uniref:hypothetical protein n=1 Tax=Ectothiorhodospira mobilis TaxID=195064 RepID=UPI001903D12F|nr:hypothetical protein [Ectothiorhodospira mobilis]MBK1690781.1 hypothetical protein [Ectothiorhodospira mobilis]
MLHHQARDELQGMLTSFPEFVGHRVNMRTLRLVEQTVENLTAEQRALESDIKASQEIAELINEAYEDEEIDPNDEIDQAYQKSQRAIASVIALYRKKRAAAVRDPQLNGTHEESVVSEYDRVLDRYRDLHEALEQVRMILREHDADASDDIGEFEDISGLMAALKEG